MYQHLRPYSARAIKCNCHIITHLTSVLPRHIWDVQRGDGTFLLHTTCHTTPTLSDRKAKTIYHVKAWTIDHSENQTTNLYNWRYLPVHTAEKRVFHHLLSSAASCDGHSHHTWRAREQYPIEPNNQSTLSLNSEPSNTQAQLPLHCKLTRANDKPSLTSKANIRYFAKQLLNKWAEQVRHVVQPGRHRRIYDIAADQLRVGLANRMMKTHVMLFEP